MKIVYLVHQFYPEYSTGTEKVVLNLARMMQTCGHRVKVLTYSFYPPSFYDRRLGGIAIREFTYASVPVLAFRYRHTPRNIHFDFENSELSEVAGDLIRREKADVVHAGHLMRVGELLRSAIDLGIPHVITLTDFFLMCPKYTLLRSDGSLCDGPESSRACGKHCPELPVAKIPKRLAIARDFLMQAKVVAAPSNFLAQMFQKEFGELNIKVIRYGLPSEGFQANSRRYGHGEPIAFCYAGSLNAHKGVHTLIQAFMAVTSANASLKIYGIKSASESYVSMLKKMAQADQRIELCGEYATSQLGQIFQRIDVVVAPSLWYENQPLVVSEALACNLPVIVSDAGGMTETVEDNFNGFTFAMGDVRRLTAILQKVADNPELLNPIKDNIGQMVFPTVEQEAYAYERIYSQVPHPC